jgi:UV excision repair protein RAD23
VSHISTDEDDEGGEINPAELLQMFQTLSAEEQEAAAQSLGMTVEQVQNFSQLIGTMTPAQIQQMFGGGGAAAAAGGRGAGGGGGQNRGRHVVSLTQEEMDSVNRLMELGFSQQDAAAAFLACDKNEALAANLLLEGWTADAAHY